MKTMTPLFNNVVIRASAGSGKTFCLSNRFLQLAFQGIPLETILATTFTRKAAGEILNRVLFRLGEAACDPLLRKTLSEQLFQDPDWIDEEQIVSLIRKVVQNFQKLRICTLDSLFIQLAQQFSLELGLPPFWTILDEVENQRLLSQSIHLTFLNAQTQDALRLMNLLFKGELKRTVEQQIDSLALNLLELYHQTKEEAWKKLPPLSGLPTEALNQEIASLEGAQVPLTRQKQTPNQAFLNAKTKIVELAKSGQWSDFIQQTLVKHVAADNLVYSHNPIEEPLARPIRQLLRHAKAEILNKIRSQTLATWETLNRIDQFFRELKHEQGAFRFEDLTEMLSSAAHQAHFQQWLESLETPTHHLLLDEFQDTSFHQWQILQPIAEKIAQRNGSPKTSPPENPAPTPPDFLPEMSSMNDSAFEQDRYSFFCVGDVKQAIYGWRGGVADIFDAIETSLPAVQFQELACNWRSSPVIIETVNRLFMNFSKNHVFSRQALEESDPYKSRKKNAAFQSAVRWQKKFVQHICAKKNQDLDGYASIEIAPLYDPDRESELLKWIADQDNPPSKDLEDLKKLRKKSKTENSNKLEESSEIDKSNYFECSSESQKLNNKKKINESQEQNGPQISIDFNEINEQESLEELQELKGLNSLEDFADLTDEEDFDDASASSQKYHQLNQKQITLLYAVHRVIALTRQHPTASVGVLVRTNALISRIVSALRKRGVDASQEGGIPLTDAASVEAILSLLTIADHPGNQIAWFHLAHIDSLTRYLNEILESQRSTFCETISNRSALEPSTSKETALDRTTAPPLFNEERQKSQETSIQQQNALKNAFNDEESRLALSHYFRQKIQTDGLGAFVNHFAQRLKSLGDVRDRERLRRLVEMSFAQEKKAIGRLDEFIECVRKTRVESQNTSKIRVMSIHKSKGLEFDIVVLPELDSAFDRFQSTVVVDRKDAFSPIDTVLRSMNKDEQELLPIALRSMFDSSWRTQFEEAFCVLYVAMTRAVRQLVMIVSPRKTQKYESLSFGHLLLNGLGEISSLISDSEKAQEPLTFPKTYFDLGNPNW